MIGAIIASDHVETRSPRMLEGERRLGAGFGQPFPFSDRPTREDRIADLARQFGFGDLAKSDTARPGSAGAARRGRAAAPEAGQPGTGQIPSRGH